jgi:hypothetical protein
MYNKGVKKVINFSILLLGQMYTIFTMQFSYTMKEKYNLYTPHKEDR